MQVTYCDLCGCPLKEGTYYMLYVANPHVSYDMHSNAQQYYNQIEKETKCICPTCRELFNRIFEYRLEGMIKLTEECAAMFNIEVKDKHPKKKEK